MRPQTPFLLHLALSSFLLRPVVISAAHRRASPAPAALPVECNDEDDDEDQYLWLDGPPPVVRAVRDGSTAAHKLRPWPPHRPSFRSISILHFETAAGTGTGLRPLRNTRS